jgi:hypothetical protein
MYNYRCLIEINHLVNLLYMLINLYNDIFIITPCEKIL